MSTIDWNTYAQAYDLLRSIRPYRAMHDTIATIACRYLMRQNGAFLDAGCGTGNLLGTMVERRVDPTRMLGIDASPAMCNIAQNKHGAQGVTIHQADLNKTLPLDAGHCAVVACVNALYAVEDPEHTIAEFTRVLHANGMLIIATPHEYANLGLVLKAHCGSTKHDSYWEQFVYGGDRARELLAEAFAHDNFDQNLVEILFTANIAITTSTEKHFLSAYELHRLCKNAGLFVFCSLPIYAGQALLLCATLRG